MEHSLQEQRRRAKDALVDVALVLTSTLELSEVLERVVKTVSELMDGDRASIWLLDDSRQELMAAAIYGLDPFVADQWKGRTVRCEDERLSYEVIKSGCPVVIDDAETHPLTDKEAVRMFGDQSILVVPLLWKDQPMGSLFLNYVRHPHEFTAEEVAVTVALANQAAVAIQNARLYTKHQQKEEALQRAFRQIGAALVSSARPDEILRLATEVALDLTDATLCLTHMREDGSLILRAARTLSWDPRQEGEFQVGLGLESEVIALGAPVRVDDLDEGRGDADGHWPRRLGLRSFVGVPLAVDGTIVGVLSAYRNEPRPFSTSEVELLSFLMTQAGAALKSAALAAETKRRAEELELVHEASAAINSSLNPVEVLSMIAETAKHVTEADVASIFVRDRDSGHELVEAVAVPAEMGYGTAIRTHGLTTQIMQQGEIVFIEDTTEDERVNPAVVDKGIRSILGVPLKVEQEVVGVLYLNAHRPGHFRARDVTLLSVLANHIAVALKNAHLYDDMLQEKEKFASIFNSSSDGVLLIDQQYRVVAINPALERMIGWNSDEVTGRPCQDVLRCTNCSQTPCSDSGCPLLQPMTGRVSVPYFESTLVTRKGSQVQVAASFSQIPDPVSGVVGVSIIRDVTELKRIEESKSDFISIVSHELRTPLSLVKGYTGTILQSKRNFTPETQLRFMQSIDQAADRMTRLVNDLLSVTRIETGKLEIKRKPFDLIELASEQVDGIRLSSRIHEIVADLPGEPVTINADRARVEQIIENLLRNAVNYSPDGGRITLFVRRVTREEVTGMLKSAGAPPTVVEGSEHVVIGVSDQGIGMTEEQKRRIFEKFFRAERGLTRSTSGLGLGLFIAKSLVVAHHGCMWVESEPGVGSTFYFTLPL